MERQSHERLLLSEGQLQVTLMRLAHQLIENHGNFHNTCVIGMQPRGVYLARRIVELLSVLQIEKAIPAPANQIQTVIQYGELDVTFHRDDFRRKNAPLVPNTTHINFLIENKHVILIDDVLYTGRTVRAALDAMLAFGRPAAVELLVLVDRRFKRETPIEAHYVGVKVDTLDNEKVLVRWKEAANHDFVLIQST